MIIVQFEAKAKLRKSRCGYQRVAVKRFSVLTLRGEPRNADLSDCPVREGFEITLREFRCGIHDFCTGGVLIPPSVSWHPSQHVRAEGASEVHTSAAGGNQVGDMARGSIPRFIDQEKGRYRRPLLTSGDADRPVGRTVWAEPLDIAVKERHRGSQSVQTSYFVRILDWLQEDFAGHKLREADGRLAARSARNRRGGLDG